MRFLHTFLFTVLAALAIAQTQQNYINYPNAGFGAQAGQQLTITWQNPSSATVTIRLTQGTVTGPGSGQVLIANIPASAKTATFTIPSDVNSAQYNLEIVDDTNPNNYNFSPGFTVAGATAGASASTASASSTGTSMMSSMSSSASSASRSASSSASMASSSASSSASSASASASSSASSASRSASSATSSAAAQTSAPSANGAGIIRAGGMVVVMAGAIAVF